MFFKKILNNIYSYYEHTEAMEGLREGSGEENGPKRHEMHCLAISKCSSFFLFVFFFTY